MKKTISTSRRKFIKNAAAYSAFTIVPRFVLGGRGFVPPADKITLGMIGTGKQSKGLMRAFLSTEAAAIFMISFQVAVLICRELRSNEPNINTEVAKRYVGESEAKGL